MRLMKNRLFPFSKLLERIWRLQSTTRGTTILAGLLRWIRNISKTAGGSAVWGGFLFGREAVKRMLPKKKGTLIFTGASAYLRGRANFGAFNSAKSGLRTLAQAKSKEYGPEGIHVAHVIIDGAINDENIKTKAPEYASKLGEEGMINLEGIVDSYVYLHRQHPQA